jgi:hypothetical protein
MNHNFNSAFCLNGIKLRTINRNILFDELNLLFVLAYFNIVKYINLFIIQLKFNFLIVIFCIDFFEPIVLPPSSDSSDFNKCGLRYLTEVCVVDFGILIMSLRLTIFSAAKNNCCNCHMDVRMK